MAKPLALALYKKTPAGMGDMITKDVTTIAHGAGYGFLRQAVEKIIDMVSEVTTNVIIVGHVKDRALVSSEGIEVGNLKDFDLTGKLFAVLKSNFLNNDRAISEKAKLWI